MTLPPVGRGRRTVAATSAAARTGSHDARGRVSDTDHHVNLPGGGAVYGHVAHTDDSADRLTTTTYPSGEVVTTSYDA
ncbi:MAG: hypothetical protein IT340_11245, partial [Chloroflexi bacterium]|nr:hypothetical protein [Chloroflexota bacterium]